MAETASTHYIDIPNEELGFSVFQSKLSDLLKAPRRTHYFLLLYCLQGEAHVMRDMQTYTLSQGMEWTLLPDNILEVTEQSEDFCVEVCCCSNSFMDEVMFHINTSFLDFLNEQPPLLLTEEYKTLNRLFMQLADYTYNDRTGMYRRRIAIHLLQAYYLGFYGSVQHLLRERQPHFSQKEEITKAFRNLLLKHFREHHDVEWYAKELCITSRYLNMVAKEITGESPKKLIDYYILTEIQMELNSSNKSIQQIAESLNFSDQSAMGRFFKMKTGMSPKQYRH